MPALVLYKWAHRYVCCLKILTPFNICVKTLEHTNFPDIT